MMGLNCTILSQYSKKLKLKNLSQYFETIISLHNSKFYTTIL